MEHQVVSTDTENLEAVQQRDVPFAPGHGDPCEAAREVSKERKWLNDLHIDHALYLLGNNFPTISGFQSTVVFESKNCVHVKAPKAQFVQILNVHGNHWLTVSNIQCNSNTINIFDSLKSSQLETSDNFNCQVATLMNCQSTSIKIEFASIKQQRGSTDCGLFAIACATSLCFGVSPETQNFVKDEMRSHLGKCFMEGKISPFPVSPSNLTPANNYFYDILLCSKCRVPQFSENSLIQCLFCNRLFHLSCDLTPCNLFICSDCKQ